MIKASKMIGSYLFRFILIFSITNSVNIVAAQEEFEESEIKAAFLYQFSNYVEWPEESFIDAGSPLVFGIIDSDELADILEQVIIDRKVNNRELQVRRLQMTDSLNGVHVLFVGQSDDETLESVLLDVASMAVLTVTETSSRPAGSIINFETIDNKVRFDVALGLAQSGNLRISSRLLQVAERVIEDL